MQPFRIDFADEDLDDLRRRIRTTRWPEREPVDDHSQGVPLEYLRELCRYWADEYDWRRCEGLSGWAVVVFMLVCRLPSRQECVSQAKPAVNAMRMQAWLPQAGTRWGRRR